MAINERDFYASHGISFDIEEMQIEYTKRVINQAKIEVLAELKSEIEELNMHGFIQLQSYRQKTGRYRQGFERAQNLSTRVIQQKIDKLKENTDGTTSD